MKSDPLPFCVCEKPDPCISDNPLHKGCGRCLTCGLPPQGEKCCGEHESGLPVCPHKHWLHDENDPVCICNCLQCDHKESSVKRYMQGGSSMEYRAKGAMKSWEVLESVDRQVGGALRALGGDFGSVKECSRPDPESGTCGECGSPVVISHEDVEDEVLSRIAEERESSVKEEIRFGDSLVIAHAGKETPVEGDWEADLQFGVMEDYLLEAAARDSESKYFGEHLELMRGHFEKLKNWIRLHLAEERQRGRDEAIENIKEIAVQGITTGLGVKLYEISEQGLESAKSPK